MLNYFYQSAQLQSLHNHTSSVSNTWRIKQDIKASKSYSSGRSQAKLLDIYNRQVRRTPEGVQAFALRMSFQGTCQQN